MEMSNEIVQTARSLLLQTLKEIESRGDMDTLMLVSGEEVAYRRSSLINPLRGVIKDLGASTDEPTPTLGGSLAHLLEDDDEPT